MNYFLNMEFWQAILVFVIIILSCKSGINISQSLFLNIKQRLAAFYSKPYYKKLTEEAIDIVEHIYNEIVRDAKLKALDGEINSKEKREILTKAKSRAVGELKGFLQDNFPKAYILFVGVKEISFLSTIIENSIAILKQRRKS